MLDADVHVFVRFCFDSFAKISWSPFSVCPVGSNIPACPNGKSSNTTTNTFKSTSFCSHPNSDYYVPSLH